MKKIRILVICIILVMVASLVGCARSIDSITDNGTDSEDATVTYDVVAHSQILTKADLASMIDEEEEEDETSDMDKLIDEDLEDDEDIDEVSDSSSSDNKTGDDDSLSESNGSYRYQDYLLEKAGETNAVFSGEAFLTQLSAYSKLLGNDDREYLEEYIERDYIGFNYDGDLKSVLRLFADSENVSFDESFELFDNVRLVDMGNANATTLKNNEIANSTDKYILSTPSGLFSNTLLDISDTIYLKGGWVDGNRPYDSESRIFYNVDGSETNTVMMHDVGTSYIVANDSVAYEMAVGDKSASIVFVLPDEDTDINDVDIEGISSGNYTERNADVEFFVPEFSIESSYLLTLDSIDYNAEVISDDVASGLSDYNPKFYQVDKFDMTRNGIGGESAEESVEFPDVSNATDKISIICNRPFLFYIYDNKNEEIAMLGVVNEITDSMAVSEETAGIKTEDNGEN